MPTTGTSRRSATTRCFCSPITVIAWRRSCDRGTSPARTTGRNCSCPRSTASRPRTARRVPGRRRLRAAGDLRGAGGARRPVRDPGASEQEPGAGDRRPPVSFAGTAEPPAVGPVQECPVSGGELDHAETDRGESRAPRRRAVPARRLHRDESPALPIAPSCGSTTSGVRPSNGSRKASRRRTGHDCPVTDSGRTRSGCS